MLTVCEKCGRSDQTASEEPDPPFIRDKNNQVVYCKFCCLKHCHLDIICCSNCKETTNGPLYAFGSKIICFTCFHKQPPLVQCQNCHSTNSKGYLSKDDKIYCVLCMEMEIIES